MNVFKNKKDGMLYTIDHLITDIKHLNNNSNAGLYITPYHHHGYPMYYFSKDEEKCRKYVAEEFIKVFEIRKL